MTAALQRSLGYAAACCLLLGLVSCKSATEPEWPFTGTYHLVSVDGQPLPVTYPTGGIAGDALTYRAAFFAVQSDSIVRHEMTVSYGDGTKIDQFDSQWLYSRDGNRVHLVSVPGAQIHEEFAIVLGQGFVTQTVPLNGRVFLYEQ